MAWLRDMLSDMEASPTYLFMHHPPMELGLPVLDPDRNRDGAELLALLAEYPSVRYIFAGHIHHPLTGCVGGIPFATMRSVLYQSPPPEPPWNWDTFAPAKEAPALGVLRFAGDDVVLRYQKFCDYAHGGAA